MNCGAKKVVSIFTTELSDLDLGEGNEGSLKAIIKSEQKQQKSDRPPSLKRCFRSNQKFPLQSLFFCFLGGFFLPACHTELTVQTLGVGHSCVVGLIYEDQYGVITG